MRRKKEKQKERKKERKKERRKTSRDLGAGLLHQRDTGTGRRGGTQREILRSEILRHQTKAAALQEALEKRRCGLGEVAKGETSSAHPRALARLCFCCKCTSCTSDAQPRLWLQNNPKHPKEVGGGVQLRVPECAEHSPCGHSETGLAAASPCILITSPSKAAVGVDLEPKCASA